PADRQLVLIQPPDHIEIDHRDRLLERPRRIVDIEFRSEQSLFLTGKCHKDQRAFWPSLFSEYPCKLDDGGRARRVVIGTVMDLRRVCCKATRAAVAEMIVMRTDD